MIRLRFTKKNFTDIANSWSALMDKKVTPQDVALSMMQLKVLREKHNHKNDNILDIIGYALCLADVDTDIDFGNKKRLLGYAREVALNET